MAPSPSPDGSTLCLACGLCCTGELHYYGRLAPAETALAQALGLALITENGGPAFRLPCRHLSDAGCQTYHRRPKVCAAYRCKLLEAYEAGNVSLEQALSRVAAVRAQQVKVEKAIGPHAADQSIWQHISAWRQTTQVDAFPDARLRYAPVLLQIAALSMRLRRHFGVKFQPEK